MADSTSTLYQDDNQKIAGYFGDVLSPLTAAGIDPDEARANRDAAIAQVTGGMPSYPGNKPYPSRPDTPPTPGASSNGTPSSTVSPSSNPSPAPTQAKTWDDYARQGLEGQLGAANDAAATTKKLASMPSDDQQLQSLEQQRAQAATPIDRNDPKYRTTVGQKIMRGIKALAVGGLPGVALADYKAPNRQYGIDKEQQSENLGSMDQQITQARKNYEDASARLKDLAAEQGKVATGYKDVVTGATTAQANENKQELQQAQAGERDAKAKLERDQATYNGHKIPSNEFQLATELARAQASSDPADKEWASMLQHAQRTVTSMRAAAKDTSAGDFRQMMMLFVQGEKQRSQIETQRTRERQQKHRDIDSEMVGEDPQKIAEAKDAADDKIDAKYDKQVQDAQDDIMQSFSGTRAGKKLAAARNAGNSGKWNAPKDAPAAPQQDGHKLMKGGKVIAVSKGGAWAQPTQ